MKKMKSKRFVSMIAAGLFVMTMLPVNVNAAENSVYEETNAYVLNYNGSYGQYIFEYGCPYVPTMTYEYANNNPYWDWTGMSDLYNADNPNEYVAVYCVDQYTSVVDNTFYKRVNLEDSEYFSADAAGLLRSIVLNGFPKVGLESLATSAGVDNLTIGEAVNATQLALWQASYGDQFKVDQFVSEINVWWQRPAYGNGAKTRNNAACYEEVENGYASMNNAEAISKNVEAVFNYLINLAPTRPQEAAVSGSSFVNWSEIPALMDNGDGTYDVTVSATVNVVEKEGDALTLSAVLGNYFESVDLVNGEQTVTLTIEDVPAAYAYGDVTIAIDGKQTVSDVYMFAVKEGREASQRRIGYSNIQLPVHEEVTAEQERIISFYKSTPVKIVGTEDQYTHLPLSNITFDLYFVAAMDEYLDPENPVQLPEEIKLSELGDSTYHYPDYTVTTDTYGWASVSLTRNNLPDGVYVVAERANPAIQRPVAPFYITVPCTNPTRDGLVYNVKITPKNEVIPGPNVDKDVISVGQNSATVNAGEEFEWIISGGIPVDMKDASMYQIVDQLDYRLTFGKENDVIVKVESADANEMTVSSQLVKDIDYLLTVQKGDVFIDADGNVVTAGGTSKEIQTVTVQLTAAGIDKVAEIAGSDYAKCKVRVYFKTSVDSDAEVAEAITNDAILNYTGSVGFTYTMESDDPCVYTCGIRINKYDAKDHTHMLSGAKFELYRLATNQEVSDGEASTLITDEGVKNVVKAGFYSTPDMTGDKVYEIETAEDDDTTEENELGIAYMYGLQEGKYYLVETKSPVGYNLLTEPIMITLDKEHLLVVKGVANSNQFRLPETGGIGTTIFKICGVALIAAAVVVLVVKKRKEKDDDEE